MMPYSRGCQHSSFLVNIRQFLINLAWPNIVVYFTLFHAIGFFNYAETFKSSSILIYSSLKQSVGVHVVNEIEIALTKAD